MDKNIQKAKKILMGEVVSVNEGSTVKVRVERKMTHPLYKKIIKSHKRYLVHNEIEGIKVGDFVYIQEGRPISKKKNFILSKKVK